MQHTTNYNLSQWEAADPVRRADFNADNAAIDAALTAIAGSAPKIAYGSYVGNGSVGGNTHTLNFDFSPKLVLVEGPRGAAYCGEVKDDYFPPILLLRPLPKFYTFNNAQYNISITWGETSVTWTSATNPYHALNAGGWTYYYLAIG